MYIGSVDDRGLIWLVKDLIGGLLRDAVTESCRQISLHLQADGAWEIAAEVLLPEMAAESLAVALAKRATEARPDSAGLADASWQILNALSERLELEIRDGRRCGRQTFSRGVSVAEDEDAPCDEPPGLTAQFAPDRSILRWQEPPRVEELRQYLERAAAFHPNITVTFRKEEAVFYRPNGIRDFFAREFPWTTFIAHAAALIPGAHAEAVLGDLSPYGPSEIRCFVNRRSVDWDGPAAEGFWRGLSRAVDTIARKQGWIAADAPRLRKKDMPGGIQAIVFLSLEKPFWGAAGRQRIRNPELLSLLSRMLREQLPAQLADREALKEHFQTRAKNHSHS